MDEEVLIELAQVTDDTAVPFVSRANRPPCGDGLALVPEVHTDGRTWLEHSWVLPGT